MQNFDFTPMMKKYPLLESRDVSFLNKFFESEQIKIVLSEIEAKRKIGFIKVVISTILFIACFVGLIYVLIYILDYSFKEDDPTGLIFAGLIGLYLWYTRRIIKSFSSSIKNQILSKLINNTAFGVKYSDISEYFKDSLDAISRNTKIIKTYDRIDFREDSIEIDDVEKGYVITGMEFATSKKHTDSKGRTSYTRNNHAYLMKVKFNDPKFKIKKPITLLTYSFFNIFKRKNLVKLENIEFEKEFDVYGEDNLEVRQILNPSFMYRIFDYVNKINNKRKYNFYFNNDYMYISYNIPINYLEISFFKSILTNIEDYVDFYLELKNISELASDLKLSFYDKEFGLNNIIK